jgi:hypothetical protein
MLEVLNGGRRARIPGDCNGQHRVEHPAASLHQVAAVSSLASFKPRLLDQHRLRSIGNVVIGNLDRIADVDNVGN